MFEKAFLARYGILYTTQNRSTKAAIVLLGRPGFTQAAQLTLMRILCMNPLTSQLRAGTPPPQSRRLQNTLVNGHWLNSWVIHLYTAEIKGIFIHLKVGEREVIQRLHLGFLNDNVQNPYPATVQGWSLCIGHEESDCETVFVLEKLTLCAWDMWKGATQIHNWSIIGHGWE